jgi:hypothetical protein
MKIRGSLLACVLGIAVAGCADPRRNAVPPPGGEPSGYNGTAGVSTMRYEQESQQAQRVAQRKNQQIAQQAAQREATKKHPRPQQEASRTPAR